MLAVQTYYSLRYGTMSPEAVASAAHRCGTQIVVLTDINNSVALFDLIKACTPYNIQVLAGVECRNSQNRLLYTLIAKNNEGYREINVLLSKSNILKRALPPRALPLNNVYVIYPFLNQSYSDLGPNEFIGVRINQINHLLSSGFRNYQDKLVMWHSATFEQASDYELHTHLRAIDRNVLLSKVSATDLASPNQLFIAQEQWMHYYRNYPQIVKTTQKLFGNCSFVFDFKGSKNKSTFTGSVYDDKVLLEKLAYEGMLYRYGSENAVVKERIEKELHIIDTLGFASYFLITWDVVRYSLSREFYHVGRGSGANSVVAFCLRITDIDPIELNLYFERFLNPKRSSPPDFDIDYSWKERDEVQAYILQKYGGAHAALLGMMQTFQGKSIVRELGKVYGLPKNEIDLLCEERKHLPNTQVAQTIARIGAQMEDFPNMRSIHAGGIVISDQPLAYYTAVDLPPKGFPTTQFDMYVAEDIGFAKFDILSQRGIGHIKDAVTLIQKNQKVMVDVHQVEHYKKDERVQQLLSSAQTIGCFYIESPAMRGLITKLRCHDYLTLVAASSIIRPGVASSGMMREFIVRFHNPAEVKYLHPVMKEQLQETYGVMVYQEDVLKVCHHFAGLDLADSDVLRRAMSGKHRSKEEFKRIVNRFFSNCKARGYSDEVTREVWRQIESFAGYSFSKAHSASYAVESFQSLYLKAYFPLEFMVAVINNFGGFYRTSVYVNEARRLGATIHLPCVNKSEVLTTLYGSDVYLGMGLVVGLEQSVADSIVLRRQQGGDYQSLEDFILRTQVGREQLILLIRIGALRFTKLAKSLLLWESHLFTTKKGGEHPHPQLFVASQTPFKLPHLSHNALEDAYDEMELLGFSVTYSRFQLLKTRYRNPFKGNELIRYCGQQVKLIGELVVVKYVRTKRNEIMHFATFLDGEGLFFDTVHFPQSLKEFPFKGYGMYLIAGKVVQEFGFASIEVQKMAPLPILNDPRGS